VKKSILFGTGMVAEELSEYIGIENIEYFVDNNLSKTGTYFKTKRIISVEQLLEIADSYEVIVAVGEEYVSEISEQLRGLNILHTCFNEFPNYRLNQKRIILSSDDVINNNHLTEMRNVYIWGRSFFARQIQEKLLKYNVDVTLIGCEKIECDHITGLIEESKTDAHILCISNNDIHIGKQKAEKIRSYVLNLGRDKVVDSFDQDIFECGFYNLEVKKYKDIYRGKRCFIIGNGPSLQKNDLECLHKNHEITFAANQIYRIFDEVTWRPDYYCCVDDLLINQCIDAIAVIECKDKFLFDYFNYPYVLEKKQNIQYIHIKGMEYETESPKFSDDITKEIYMGYTVTYAMLQIACYMGFKEIYLIGVDHSDFNKHFIHNYYEKDMKTYPFTYGNRALLAYKSAKRYCDKNKINVYNVTRGGKLEVFERRDFNDIFYTT
jgi:hypothetical protein